MDIHIKRVYEQEEPSDGFRVLVDKLWPRGIKKESLHYDLWAKNITPSTSLREWYHQDEVGRWSEFEQKYCQELSENTAIDDFITKISEQQTVTLLYASKNAINNHAIILRDYLLQRINVDNS